MGYEELAIGGGMGGYDSNPSSDSHYGGGLLILRAREILGNRFYYFKWR